LCFHGKLHGQLVQHLLGITVHNHADCFFGVDSALVAIKNLVFPDF